MQILKALVFSLSRKERMMFFAAITVLVIAGVSRGALAIKQNSSFVPVHEGVYKEGVLGQPSAVNPVISSNPADQDISSLIYSSLGDLAKNIKLENEGRTYTITLEEGLMWSDGEPLTTDDVVFTLKLIQNPEVRSPLAKNWRSVSAERISELSIKLSLPAPYTFFENNLYKLFIIPSHIFGSIPPSNIGLSSYNLEPVGSGPYEFTNFKRKKNGFITEYRLAVNNNYHKDGPFIQEFIFLFYENEQKLIDALRVREIDGFGTLSPLTKSIYELPRILVERAKMSRYYAAFFNPKATSALENKIFRQALDMAIDKDRLTQEAVGDEAQLMPGLVNLLQEIDYDGARKDEALELIKKVKKDENVDEIDIKITIPEVDFIEAAANFIAREWRAIGIDKVEILSLPIEEFFTIVIRERNYEVVLFGNVLENDLDLFPFWHSSERFYPGLNLSFYANDEVDIRLETLRQLKDDQKRREEFMGAATIITEEAPASFLFSLPYIYVHHDRLKGFGDNSPIVIPADRFKNITSWYVKEARVVGSK